MHKRSFLKKAVFAGLGGLLGSDGFARSVEKAAGIPLEVCAADEDFWLTVRKCYKLKPDYINLENGYYNFVPEPTLERFMEHVRDVNYHASFFMRNNRVKTRRAMAAKLAEIAGCSPEELTITRNTTESLDMIIGGLDWEKGDEAVYAEQDYGSMRGMFGQIARRYGVVNKVVSVPNLPGSDDEIVNLYASAITAKTKLLMVSHIVNITGQILPVRKICDMAHQCGVQVLVDGAHSLGHFRFSIRDLDCDYFGSSLHKWMSVPLGCGILFVKKDRISGIWPLMSEGLKPSTDINKLGHIGTNPIHTELAIDAAIEFYNMLGAERKETRLRYLQNYWTSQVRNIPKIIMNTPADPARACGIATVGIRGVKPSALKDILFNKYKIYTAPIDGSGVNGVRVTPNVFTTTEELDVLVNALKEIQ